MRGSIGGATDTRRRIRLHPIQSAHRLLILAGPTRSNKQENRSTRPFVIRPPSIATALANRTEPGQSLDESPPLPKNMTGNNSETCTQSALSHHIKEDEVAIDKTRGEVRRVRPDDCVLIGSHTTRGSAAVLMSPLKGLTPLNGRAAFATCSGSEPKGQLRTTKHRQRITANILSQQQTQPSNKRETASAKALHSVHVRHEPLLHEPLHTPQRVSKCIRSNNKNKQPTTAPTKHRQQTTATDSKHPRFQTKNASLKKKLRFHSMPLE